MLWGSQPPSARMRTTWARSGSPSPLRPDPLAHISAQAATQLGECETRRGKREALTGLPERARLQIVCGSHRARRRRMGDGRVGEGES
eukprot:11763110-Alexandrium_andersonii.AAC.1